MTFKATTEAFLQMENELDLFDQQIDGVYFWERIRFSLHHEILKNAGVIGQAHTKLEPTLLNRTTTILMAARNILFWNPYLSSPRDLVFVGHPRRKLQEDGKWWDLYCDPIIEDLSSSYAYLESSYLNTHLTPAKTAGIRYLDLIDVLAGIERRLRVTRIHLSRRERDLLQHVREEIAIRFNIDVNLDQIVIRNLLNRKSMLPLYKILLRKLGPRLAIVVVSYGKETFIEACKELHIPVVELQHGVISPYHLAYSYPGLKKTKRSFPDYFFAFGDYWKECVEFPIARERVYSIGYPYLESEARKYANILKKDQIVVISQGTVGKEISKFAVKLAKSCSADQEIVYKLHPGEYARWKKEYPWLVDAGIRVIEDDSVPLYRLFAESKIQIGVNSTAIYEGLIFGLRTFLLNLPGVEYMGELLESGYTHIISSVDELQVVLKGTAPIDQIDTEEFFRSNALENVYKAINDILTSTKGTKA